MQLKMLKSFSSTKEKALSPLNFLLDLIILREADQLTCDTTWTEEKLREVLQLI